MAQKKMDLVPAVVLCAGIILGVLGTISTRLLAPGILLEKSKALIAFGTLLDTDIVYYKSGEILKGTVVSDDGIEILIKTKNSTVITHYDDILRIDYNAYARYLKEVL